MIWYLGLWHFPRKKFSSWFLLGFWLAQNMSNMLKEMLHDFWCLIIKLNVAWYWDQTSWYWWLNPHLSMLVCLMICICYNNKPTHVKRSCGEFLWWDEEIEAKKFHRKCLVEQVLPNSLEHRVNRKIETFVKVANIVSTVVCHTVE